MKITYDGYKFTIECKDDFIHLIVIDVDMIKYANVFNDVKEFGIKYINSLDTIYKIIISSLQKEENTSIHVEKSTDSLIMNIVHNSGFFDIPFQVKIPIETESDNIILERKIRKVETDKDEEINSMRKEFKEEISLLKTQMGNVVLSGLPTPIKIRTMENDDLVDFCIVDKQTLINGIKDHDLFYELQGYYSAITDINADKINIEQMYYQHIYHKFTDKILGWYSYEINDKKIDTNAIDLYPNSDDSWTVILDFPFQSTLKIQDLDDTILLSGYLFLKPKYYNITTKVHSGIKQHLVITNLFDTYTICKLDNKNLTSDVQYVNINYGFKFPYSSSSASIAIKAPLKYRLFIKNNTLYLQVILIIVSNYKTKIITEIDSMKKLHKSELGNWPSYSSIEGIHIDNRSPSESSIYFNLHNVVLS